MILLLLLYLLCSSLYSIWPICTTNTILEQIELAIQWLIQLQFGNTIENELAIQSISLAILSVIQLKLYYQAN